MLRLRKGPRTQEEALSLSFLEGAINDLDEAIDRLIGVRDEARDLREEYAATRNGVSSDDDTQGGAGTR